ncbi:MAG: hypothetical protein WD314_15790 [Trueperaceae bacterium]
MGIFRVVVLFGTAVLLTSCAVTVQPRVGFEAHAVGVSDGRHVNERLGLVGYPGSTVIRQEQDRSSSKTTFESRASLDAVYAHFHGQLGNQGWRRFELDSKPNHVNAEYRRSGEELEFELKREGQSGRYRLELELDD